LNGLQTPSLHIALIHYPVVDKNGATIASAVTNLDLHDIARAAKTYGLESFYVVTPLADQKVLVESIIAHWVTGAGAKYNPKRRQALELIRIAHDLDEVIGDLASATGRRPVCIGTSARQTEETIGYYQLRRQFREGTPYLLMLGTAWGLSEEILHRVDYRLPPITGPGDYNHLSVRCAAAIILDRLLASNKKD